MRELVFGPLREGRRVPEREADWKFLGSSVGVIGEG